VPIRFAMSVCLLCITTRETSKSFSCNLILNNFSKTCRRIPFWLNWDNSSGHFTWRRTFFPTRGCDWVENPQVTLLIAVMWESSDTRRKINSMWKSLPTVASDFVHNVINFTRVILVGLLLTYYSNCELMVEFGMSLSTMQHSQGLVLKWILYMASF
jgi:hypothetical protein